MQAVNRLRILCATLFALLLSDASSYASDRITHKYRDIKIQADSSFIDHLSDVKAINAFINFSPVKMPSAGDSIVFSLYSREKTGYKIGFKWNENKFAAFDDNNMFLTFSIVNAENDSTVLSRKITDPKIVNFDKHSNQLSIFGNKFDGINLYLNKKTHLANISWKYDISDISATSSADLYIKKYTLRAIKDNGKYLNTGYNLDNIKDIIKVNANDSLVGFYKYVDKIDNEKYAVVGGKYLIALLPDDAGNYTIIYISGATAYTNSWKTGMIKGILKRTVFANNYDLGWYDSRMEVIDDECSATILDNNIIELNFPLLKSQIRFVKIDKL